MIKYKIKFTTLFKKQRKFLIKRGFDIKQLDDVILSLANGETLSPKCCDHALSGNRKGYRDCHISHDWLLIYKIDNDILTLLLSETGTHSDLFG
jgi:mRNA interferase YafQ